MSPTDRPRELLEIAKNDYDSAIVLVHAEKPQRDAAGFHLQQAVEKSLKAWLALKRIEYPKTHDLNPLLGLLEDQDENVEPFWPLLELNPFAVQFRYELAGEAFPNFEQLAHLSRQLLAHVQSLLAGG
ncbi:MAG: HEPN domain-containing protein [Phycisphaerales bacterium]